MFERFTEQAREVVVQAQRDARRLRHDHIGTEHLLLGLVDEEHGVGGQVLRAVGVDAAAVEDAVLRRVGTGPGVLDDADAAALRVIGIDLDSVRAAAEESFGVGALQDAAAGRRPRCGPWTHVPLTRRAKKVLELALREAVQLRHRHLGTEHILLGLLREGEGLGVRVLADVGVDLGGLRGRVLDALTTPA